MKLKHNLRSLVAFPVLALGTLAIALTMAAPLILSASAPAQAAEEPQRLEIDEIVIAKKDGEKIAFSVELAQTSADQERGLMFREHMPNGHGMLFLFGNERQRSFWMKDTLIPLDILFVARNGRIHHIHHNARPLDTTHVTSQFPSFAVLEINGGLSDQLGIETGDMIYHDAFRNMNLLAR